MVGNLNTPKRLMGLAINTERSRGRNYGGSMLITHLWANPQTARLENYEPNPGAGGIMTNHIPDAGKMVRGADVRN